MTGNPTVDKIILILNGALVSAAAGLVIFSHTLIKKPATKQALEMGNMIENSVSELKKTPVTFDEIVVNLYSRETRLRFLNTQINLEIFEEKDRELVMGMKAVLFDALIDITGNLKPREINSVTGKLLLEKNLKDRVNDYIGRNAVKTIYFSKFIVQ